MNQIQNWSKPSSSKMLVAKVGEFKVKYIFKVLRILASGFGWTMTHFNNDLYVGAPLADQAKGAVYQCKNLQSSPNCDEKVLH